MKFNQSIDSSDIIVGDLITVTFQSGGKRSGVVTNVLEDLITYAYFDPVSESIQTTNIDLKENQTAIFTTTKHLKEEVTEEKPSIGFIENETKIEKKEQETNFFDYLKNVRNVEPLIRAFKGEDAQTLALIAHYLDSRTQMEFLYRLPDRMFSTVNGYLKNVSNISRDVLSQIEGRLAKKYEEYKHLENETNEKKQKEKEEQFTNEKHTTGGNPFEELFGDFIDPSGFDLNPEDIASMFGSGSSENQPPLPDAEQLKEMMEGMMENMPKMIEDIFGNLNDRKDDEDDDENKKY